MTWHEVVGEHPPLPPRFRVREDCPVEPTEDLPQPFRPPEDARTVNDKPSKHKKPPPPLVLPPVRR